MLYENYNLKFKNLDGKRIMSVGVAAIATAAASNGVAVGG